MEYPRVLVISHTAFSKEDSMGSTLATYFMTYNPDNVAQFYIKEMNPNIHVCKHFFRVTDNELVQKIMHPIKGTVGKTVELVNEADLGTAARVSAAGGHKHRDIAMLGRKLLWSTQLWNTKEFQVWIEKYNPQVILVQPGDFSYLLDMAVFLANKYRLPIVVHQSETYYLKEYEKKTLFYRLFRYDFKRSYERLMKQTSYCVYLCEAIEDSYKRFFNVPCETIMKATNIKPEKSPRVFDKHHVRFIYGGNLGETVGRCEPLVEIGCVVKKLGFHIDVFTSSTGAHMSALIPENGIHLHGPVTYEQLQTEIKNSDFVLHIESQRPWNVKDLEYAFSTKIADMLASGVCSIIYGSEKIASIRYFKEHNLGLVIENANDIETSLVNLINNESLREEFIRNAIRQAEAEHNPITNSNRMKEIIYYVHNAIT